MKSVDLKNLSDKDILALDISTNDGCIILSKGTVLNKRFADKLERFGINEVFVEDPTSPNNNENEDSHIPKNNDINYKKVFENRKKVLSNYCSIFCDAVKKNSISYEKLKTSSESIISSVLLRIDDNTLDILYTENPYFCHYTHSMNVAALSVFLGKKLNIGDKALHELAISALLHDIGMYNIPNEIISKSGDLNEDDISIVKRHTIYGYEKSKTIKSITEGCRLGILHHHERFDGRGYPFKLKGKNIPLYARIIAVADIFCSLTSKTKNHPGYSYLDSYEFILAGSGLYFDPDVVEVFQKHFVIYPIGCNVKLNDGHRGIVISQNMGFPDRPNVQILCDKDGRETFPVTVNLLKKVNIKIDKI